jgi:hypothetical protein
VSFAPSTHLAVMSRSSPSGLKRMLSRTLGPRRYRALRQAQWAAGTEWRDSRFAWLTKFSAWRRGFTADSAALYEFPRPDWQDYLSDYVRENQCVLLNAVPHVFDQKLMLRVLLLHHGFKQAETFALIARSDVQLDPFGTQSRMTTLAELESSMQHDGGPFIVKPQDSGMGFGVALVSAENGALTRRRGHKVSTYRVRASSTSTLVERVVRQHEAWQAFFGGSANTMRLLTLWTPGEAAPFIAAAAQRIGASDTAPTDNFAGGGMAAHIGLETGVLGHARRRSASGRPDRLTHHHETGVRIEGAQLPFWERIRETVLSAASLLGVARYVGWDVMIDAAGTPVIIEGNANTGVHILQLDAGLLKQPQARRFYEQCGVL